jgi:PadR family transcriptional regulator, regulatory protein AphA
MARENKSRFAILGLLSLQPMSGYDIRKKIAVSIGHFWSEGYGQIYPILKQLEVEGLATSNHESQTGKPDRVVYAITEAGHDELRTWLKAPIEAAIERNELLLKLFFGRQLAPADNLAHLRHFQERQQQLLAEFEELREQMAGPLAHLPDAPYWRLVISYGLHSSQAMLRWCDEATAALKAESFNYENPT